MKVLIKVEIDENHQWAEANKLYDLLKNYKPVLMPMPMKRISTVDWLHTETQTQSATSIGKYPSDYTQIKTYEPSDYDKGWNDCVDFLEGDMQDD